MGQYLPGSFTAPAFLDWPRVTLKIMKTSGTMPDSIELLNKYVWGMESGLLAILIR